MYAIYIANSVFSLTSRSEDFHKCVYTQLHDDDDLFFFSFYKTELTFKYQTVPEKIKDHCKFFVDVFACRFANVAIFDVLHAEQTCEITSCNN